MSLASTVEAQLPRYLAELASLVNVDCGSYTPEGVNRVAGFCAEALSAMGASVERLPAERLGKHKTSWQIVTILFFLVLLAARELKYAGHESGWWLTAWYRGGPVLIWVAVALTLYSGLGYAWRHREVIASEQ